MKKPIKTRAYSAEDRERILSLFFTGERENIDLALQLSKSVGFDAAGYFGFSEWKQLQNISRYKLFAPSFSFAFNGNPQKHILARETLWSYVERLQQLEVLDLQNCDLEDFYGYHLDCFPRLRELNLSYNEFKRLQAHNFAGLQRLERLDLSFCKIRSIEAYTFEPLTNLTWLSLDWNNLYHIHAETFAPMQKLETLYLWEATAKASRERLHSSSSTVAALRSVLPRCKILI